MNHFLKTLSSTTLSLLAATAFSAAAPPKQLITHNTTDSESNAFIDGSIPSHYPTKAHSDGKVFWTIVKMACFGHTVGGKCSAVIKMNTDTPNPITIGTVSMDLESGDISPKQLSSNGYTMIVNGPGETTLTQD
jgi:hypothetical protein